MGLADFFFDIGTQIASGDLVVLAIMILIAFIGMLIFSRFPMAGGLLVIGFIGYLFSVSIAVHSAFRFIYFGSLVGAGILIALLIWNIFSTRG